MKAANLFTLIFVLTVNLSAQKICSLTPQQYNTSLCIEDYSPTHLSINMTKAVNDILRNAGLNGSNFIIKNCNNVENAIALNYKNERFILMDENYFSNLLGSNNLMYLMILGHEIGHHLHGHLVTKTISDIDERRQELQADRFSGYIIGKKGFDFVDVEKIARNVFPTESSKSHPGLNERLDALKQGYNDAISEQQAVINRYYSNITEHILEKITKNNLITSRDEYTKLIDHFTEEQLNKVIESYLRIKFISDDFPFIEGELAQLYALKNDFVNAHVMALSAYDKLIAKNIEISSFLVLSWEYSNKGNFKLDDYHLNKLKEIDYKQIHSPDILKYFAQYCVSENNLELALEVLDFSLTKFNINTLSNDDQFLYSDILNDKSILYFRLENYELAYENIKKAINMRRLADSKNYSTQNINNLIDKVNEEVLFSNLVLLDMKTGNFKECVSNCNDFIKKYPDSEYLKNGDVYYYLGRSLLELKNYEESISNLSKSIKVSPLNHYLYYYRGLAFYGLNNKLKACMDFTISCDGEFSPSCNRLKLLCNE
jgi:tetratricopeptide (TPR) repeat protein